MVTITYQEEKFSALYDEAAPLLERHYREIAPYQDRLPLKPHRAYYEQLEQASALVIVTARSDGNLVGYLAALIGPRLHNVPIIGATADVVWIAPEHRNLGVGNAIFDYMEGVLAKRGALTFQCNSKSAHPALAFLLDARGYDRYEIVHLRFLNAEPA